MNQRRRRREHNLQYKKMHLLKKASKETPSEVIRLRVCKCGTTAFTEEELPLFRKNSKSKHGYENTCLKCAAAARKKTSVQKSVPNCMQKVCRKCGKVATGSLELSRTFRRINPSGNLAAHCKECELLTSNCIEIGGRYINIKDLKKPKRLLGGNFKSSW